MVLKILTLLESILSELILFSFGDILSKSIMLNFVVIFVTVILLEFYSILDKGTSRQRNKHQLLCGSDQYYFVQSTTCII